MARYIDADRLITKIHELYVQPNIELWQVVKCVGNSPTADVVPKSEVDRLNAVMKEMDEQRAYTINMLGESLEKAKAEVERLEKTLDEYEETSGLKQAKAEVAREIFAEIEKAVDKGFEYGTFFDVKRNIAELKKKYTEGET